MTFDDIITRHIVAHGKNLPKKEPLEAIQWFRL